VILSPVTHSESSDARSTATMGEQVVKQITATLTAFVWSGVGSLIIYKVIDATIGLRVTEEQERDGLDLSDHGETAYN
jgi:Amt family ammonium transporter